MDLAEFVSDYVQTYRDTGERMLPKAQLAKNIALAYCEANPDTAGLDDAAFLDVAHNSIAPQVAYYL
jgi:hypothetical protein